MGVSLTLVELAVVSTHRSRAPLRGKGCQGDVRKIRHYPAPHQLKAPAMEACTYEIQILLCASLLLDCGSFVISLVKIRWSGREITLL